MYPFGEPPDHVTVNPLERVTGVGLAESGGGLVMVGSAGRLMDVLKLGTSAPPGALTVIVPGEKKLPVLLSVVR
jgi:hypothetical protein